MKNRKELINFIKGTKMFLENFNNIDLISLGAMLSKDNGISFSTKMVDGKLN